MSNFRQGHRLLVALLSTCTLLLLCHHDQILIQASPDHLPGSNLHSHPSKSSSLSSSSSLLSLSYSSRIPTISAFVPSSSFTSQQQQVHLFQAHENIRKQNNDNNQETRITIPTLKTNNLHSQSITQLYMKSPVRRRRGFFNNNDDEEDDFDEDEYEEITLPTNSKKNYNKDDIDDDDNDGNDREYEYVRVGRRKGRFADQSSDYTSDTPSSSSNQRSNRNTNYREDDDYDFYDFNDKDDYKYANKEKYINDDYDLDEDDDDDEDDEYDGIIPNELLDQIDPDGAIDRLPELFADGKFWRDTALVGLFVFMYALSRLTFDMNEVVSVDQINFDSFYK